LLQLATFNRPATIAMAQGTQADYRRAIMLPVMYPRLPINVMERANWIDKTRQFWYRKTVKGGSEFVLVDAETLSRKPAFDHERLAASLSSAAGEKYTATSLPFTSITFVDNQGAIQFTAARSIWKCDLPDYSCKKLGPAPQFGQGRPPEDEVPAEYENDVYDGMVREPVQAAGGRAALQRPTQEAASDRAAVSKASPDGRWEASIQNYNLFLKPKGRTEASPLSYDGSEGNYYTLASVAWSPDSKKLAAFRVRAGYHRRIQYVESSPIDQLQPRYSSVDYAKPGDALDMPQPVLFDVAAKKEFVVDNALFPNPYEMSRPEWRKDSRAFTFEYNQRGHQVYRVIEVDAATGAPRAVISEEPKTFFCYSGKKYRFDAQTAKRSFGCRSATAGTISTCSTAPPAP